MGIGNAERVTLNATPSGVGNFEGRTLSWVSSNAAVASVNSSGVVTGNKAGSATITVSCDEGEATASVTVINLGSTTNALLISELVFENEQPAGNMNLYNDGIDLIGISFSNGTNNDYAPKFYTNDKTLRVYNGNTMTITSSKANIQRVTFASSGAMAISAASGVINGKVWTSATPVNSITFTGTATSKITSISVTYFDASSFVSGFMHMTDYDPDLDNSDGDGSCEDYYPLANSAYARLFETDKTAFCTENAYADARARLAAWASANGESLNLTTHVLGFSNNGGLLSLIKEEDKNSALIIVIISLVSLTAIGGYFFIRRRKER